jgi:phage repressor protein C with HTH and peptisase S24 domain
MEQPSVAPGAMTARVADVPVHALVGSPVHGAYYWNQTVIDYTCRPPGIARATRAFAFRMPDDSMEGWRQVDELIFVDPTRAVAEGDHALVELANTEMPDNPSLYVVRRVLRRRPAGVVLQTWGLNPEEQSMPRANVLSFHKVIEWPELLGC